MQFHDEDIYVQTVSSKLSHNTHIYMKDELH